MSEQQVVNWDSMSDVAAAVNDWANRTFPGRAPGSSLVKLNMAEIPELLTHMNEHGSDGIGPEWADCMILLLDLARIWGINPARAIEEKMRINNGRMWTKDPATGMFQHVKLEPKVDFSSAEEVRK